MGSVNGKMITLKDCQDLYERFIKYTETAEQYEFPILLKLQLMMEHSLKRWQDPINQEEAAAMFRVVEKVTGIRYETIR